MKQHLKKLTPSASLSLIVAALLLFTISITINNTLTKQEERTHAANATNCTLFVAKNGNNNNSGTETLPFLTIQKAANTAIVGDIVCVKTGTYNERVTFTNSGSAPDSYITFQNYSTDVITLVIPKGGYVSSQNCDGSNNGFEGGFTLSKVSYIKIKGFVFTKAATGSDDPTAYITTGCGSHHITIDGNKFYEAMEHKILLAGYFTVNGIYASWNIDFINNYVLYLERDWISVADELISVDSVNYMNVSNNYIDGANGLMIVYKGNTQNSIVSNNKLFNSDWKNPGNPWFGYKTQAIYIDGGWGTIKNISVFNNYLQNTLGIIINAECKGWHMSDVYVYNNIVTDSYWGIVQSFDNKAPGDSPCSRTSPDSTMTNIQIYNNTVYNIANNGVPGADQTPWGYKSTLNTGEIKWVNNLYYGGANKISIKPNNYQSTNSWNINPAGSDPNFVNVANHDFHLSLGSYAKDIGTTLGDPFKVDFDGNTRPVGSAFDIGAYEWCTGSNCITAPVPTFFPSTPPTLILSPTPTLTPTPPYVTPTLYCLGLSINKCLSQQILTRRPTQIPATPDTPGQPPPPGPGNNPPIIGGAFLLIPLILGATIYYLQIRRKQK
ncbi:hypothetical protein KKF69_08710 [Patescibacteria group bacterium]|nr:hypothetical protein [Patescibacteria group bacterium]